MAISGNHLEEGEVGRLAHARGRRLRQRVECEAKSLGGLEGVGGVEVLARELRPCPCGGGGGGGIGGRWK